MRIWQLFDSGKDKKQNKIQKKSNNSSKHGKELKDDGPICYDNNKEDFQTEINVEECHRGQYDDQEIQIGDEQCTELV